MNLYKNDDGSWSFGHRPTDQGATYIGAYKNKDLVNFMSQDSANQTNIQLAQQNNDFNERMWNMNNDYNTPSAQVQRLIDAGINPSSQMGNYYNTSQSQVQGSQASVEGGQIDPNSQVERFNSVASAFASVMSSLKEVYSQYNDTRRVANESRALDQNDTSLVLQGKQLSVQSRLTNAIAAAQEFQNAHQDETYRNQQDSLVETINNLKKDGKLKDEQLKQLEEVTPWLSKIKQKEYDSLVASISKINAETNGIWNENAVKKFYAELANKGIDPNAEGLSIFLKTFLQNPEGFAPLMAELGKSLGVGLGNVVNSGNTNGMQHIPGARDVIKFLFNSIPSIFNGKTLNPKSNSKW